MWLCEWVCKYISTLWNSVCSVSQVSGVLTFGESIRTHQKKKKSILHYFRLVSENELIRDLSTVLDPSFFTDFLTSVQCICGPVYYPPMFTDFLTSVSIFAGLTILWNLVLMVTWVPAWIVLHHKVIIKSIIIIIFTSLSNLWSWGDQHMITTDLLKCICIDVRFRIFLGNFFIGASFKIYICDQHMLTNNLLKCVCIGVNVRIFWQTFYWCKF